ncbi:MAG: type II toxin-antitoxin system RelE/ParE family toxin [Halioglobus sp.]
MNTIKKPLVWLKQDLESPPFSPAAKLKAGYFLRLLQHGVRLSLPTSRPTPFLGGRCHELRIDDGEKTWRLVYRSEPDVILILVLFEKVSCNTPKSVIDTCTLRLEM